MSLATPPDLAWVDRGARAVARHWLLFFNSLALLFAALPWIGPLLQGAGYDRTGRLLFFLYGSLCHQLPERSFFVGGHQVCYCHRCTALYTTVAMAGLLYGLIRWRVPLPTRALLWVTLPILIDGVWHIADDLLPGLGLRSTFNGVGSVNFWTRMVTGMLVGAAAVLWAYPRLNQELAHV